MSLHFRKKLIKNPKTGTNEQTLLQRRALFEKVGLNEFASVLQKQTDINATMDYLASKNYYPITYEKIHSKLAGILDMHVSNYPNLFISIVFGILIPCSLHEMVRYSDTNEIVAAGMLIFLFGILSIIFGSGAWENDTVMNANLKNIDTGEIVKSLPEVAIKEIETAITEGFLDFKVYYSYPKGKKKIIIASIPNSQINDSFKIYPR